MSNIMVSMLWIINLKELESGEIVNKKEIKKKH